MGFEVQRDAMLTGAVALAMSTTSEMRARHGWGEKERGRKRGDRRKEGGGTEEERRRNGGGREADGGGTEDDSCTRETWRNVAN
eukprot:8248234-Pyramimonas_sp.AAC.1